MSTVFTYNKTDTIHLELKHLGRGGEGKIYASTNKLGLVAKIFKPSKLTPDLHKKLQIMVANPPPNPSKNSSHISFAWPEEIIYDKKGMFVGYLMPKLKGMRSLYSTMHSKTKHIGFTWQYSVTAAKNLAKLVSILHNHGCVVGDLNESNIMVDSKALISILDCDSMQIIDPATSNIYRSRVKKDDYLPAELQNKNLDTTTRYTYHDNFSLAILIFQLLMRGVNPYYGNGGSTPRASIAKNASFVVNNNVKPPTGTPPLDVLPSSLLTQFKTCFEKGYSQPSSRPSAQEWVEALTDLSNNLKQCKNDKNHYYSTHRNTCPWCQYKSKQQIVKRKRGLPKPTNPYSSTIVPPKQTFKHTDVVVSSIITFLVYGSTTALVFEEAVYFWIGAIAGPIIFLITYSITVTEDGQKSAKAVIFGLIAPLLVGLFLVIAAVALAIIFLFYMIFGGVS